MDSKESLHKNTTTEEDRWDILKNVEQSNPTGSDNKEKPAKPETAKEKQERINNAAANVQAVFNSREQKSYLTKDKAQETSQDVIETPRHRSWLQSISKAYDEKERLRVERIKSELSLNMRQFRELKGIPLGVDMSPTVESYYTWRQAAEPTVFRKAIRFIGDRLGIKIDEAQREKEAARIALAEYKEERAKKSREERAKKKEEVDKSEQEKERRRKKEDQEAKQEKKEVLANKMASGRKKAKREKIKQLKNQRSQEIIERDLNSRLLKIDDLETEVLSGNPGISKETKAYDGIDIPIYNLKGLPYSILSTTIDYRKANKVAVESGSYSPDDLIGIETYQEILKNPAKWAERRDVAEQSAGFGTRGVNALGDIISCSYHNSETNNHAFVEDSEKTGSIDNTHDLLYGFENVEGDSVILITNEDGGTSNIAGKSNTMLNEHKLDIIEELQWNPALSYDEVTLRRYSENGYPKRPDYILTMNGRITDAALLHAKYFGIPIVNIEMSIYDEKQTKRGRDIMDSINEEDDYLDIYAKMMTVHSLGSFMEFDVGVIKNARTIDTHGVIEPQYIDAAKIEFEKRIDYIKNTLENIINKTTPSLNKKETLSSIVSSEFTFLDLSLYDAQQQRIINTGGLRLSANRGPENFITIKFVPKNGRIAIETLLSEQKDSVEYHILEPVIRRYLELTRQSG